MHTAVYLLGYVASVLLSAIVSFGLAIHLHNKNLPYDCEKTGQLIEACYHENYIKLG